MPATMTAYQPMEIIVMPSTTYIRIDYIRESRRRIFTDGRAWPKEIEPGFDGYSIGKWVDEDGDGKFDVLEAETRYFKGPRAFDLSGIPLHEDNETVIKERIYLDKADKNLLHDEITVDRQCADAALDGDEELSAVGAGASREWPEYLCVESSETMRIGNETYLVNKDGYADAVQEGPEAAKREVLSQSRSDDDSERDAAPITTTQMQITNMEDYHALPGIDRYGRLAAALRWPLPPRRRSMKRKYPDWAGPGAASPSPASPDSPAMTRPSVWARPSRHR